MTEPKSPKPLGDFLSDLVVDPELLGQFIANPAAAAEAAGLGDQDREALLQGDAEYIARAVNCE